MSSSPADLEASRLAIESVRSTTHANPASTPNLSPDDLQTHQRVTGGSDDGGVASSDDDDGSMLLAASQQVTSEIQLLREELQRGKEAVVDLAARRVQSELQTNKTRPPRPTVFEGQPSPYPHQPSPRQTSRPPAVFEQPSPRHTSLHQPLHYSPYTKSDGGIAAPPLLHDVDGTLYDLPLPNER